MKRELNASFFKPFKNKQRYNWQRTKVSKMNQENATIISVTDQKIVKWS